MALGVAVLLLTAGLSGVFHAALSNISEPYSVLWDAFIYPTAPSHMHVKLVGLQDNPPGPLG